METIALTYQVAKKQYVDDCWPWLEQFMAEDRDCTSLTISEVKEIIKARNRGWVILPGERYCRTVNKDDGEIYVFKSNPTLIGICQKLKLWDL